MNDILNETNINETDTVFEIGAGKGHLTRELVKRSRCVVALELDGNLCRIARNTVQSYRNIKVIQKDILKFNLPANGNYKIFGNIPYNISTDIVKKIAFESRSEYSYLIVEYGFAKRLQDTKRALGLLLMAEMDIEIIRKIPCSYFHPQPNVDSVLIVLKQHPSRILKKDHKIYHHFVYKWVNREYRVLFTKNQLRQALKHAKVTDIDNMTKEQFLSIFNSYRLFN